MNLRDKTEQEIRDAVAQSTSFQGALRLLTGVNLHHNGAKNQWLRKKIDELNIDTSHMIHSNQGKHFGSKHTKADLEDIFCINSSHIYARRRNIIISKNLIPYKCAICGLEGEWNGKELTLTLDHINGNRQDNRLSNLRFICPNCDRQLDTHGSKNKVRYMQPVVKKHKERCVLCGKEITRGSKMCVDCRKAERRKAIPLKEVLMNDLRNFTSFLELGKKYGVSDNAVRKWCKHYKLPYKSSEIKQLFRKTT